MPLATVGDLTSHGIPLSPGPGSTNVSIGGKRVWRVMDNHMCPIYPINIHGRGIVIIRDPSVLINNFPVAKRGDLMAETGTISSIMTGNQSIS